MRFLASLNTQCISETDVKIRSVWFWERVNAFSKLSALKFASYPEFLKQKIRRISEVHAFTVPKRMTGLKECGLQLEFLGFIQTRKLVVYFFLCTGFIRYGIWSNLARFLVLVLLVTFRSGFSHAVRLGHRNVQIIGLVFEDSDRWHQ